MAILLALLVVAVTLILARKGFLHPGDYLVEASLALFLALFVVVLTPSAAQDSILAASGSPTSALARSAFLRTYGVSIELASIIVALGAVAAAALRGKAFGGWHPSENRG